MTALVSRQDLTGSSQMYVITVHAPNPNSLVVDIGGDQISTDETGIAYYDNSFSSVIAYSTDPVITYYAQTILEVNYESSSNAELYVNGSELSYAISSPGIYAPTGTATLDVGSGADKIQEVIIWPLNKSASRSDIYSNVNTY